MAKTVVGSFEDFDEAERVQRALVDAGFAQGDISIMANDASGRYAAPGATERPAMTPEGAADAASTTGSAAGTGAVAGAVLGGGAGLAAGLMGLAIPGIGPIIAAGPIAAALAGAGVGAVAGGLVGALTHIGVPEEHAPYYAEAVRRGGALVTVASDDARAEDAARIMRDHGAIDIDRRVQSWRDSGWQTFDAAATPYTAADVERERSLWRPAAGVPGATLGGTTAGTAMPGTAGRGSTAGATVPATEREHAMASGTRRNESLGDKIERAIPGDSDRDGK